MRGIVLYDNEAGSCGCRPDWGFSVVIEFGEKLVWFDAGESPDVLRWNVRKCGFPKEGAVIDHLVISHRHHDHIGGLPYIFSSFRVKHLWLPTDAIVQGIPDGTIVHRGEHGWLERGLFLVGEVPAGALREQSLVVYGDEGTLLLVGCSHPGVLVILEEVKKRLGTYPDYLMGGMHLYRKRAQEITDLWEKLRYMVKKVAPLHCTGRRGARLLGVEWKEGVWPVRLCQWFHF